jgi:hypothetical protein
VDADDDWMFAGPQALRGFSYVEKAIVSEFSANQDAITWKAVAAVLGVSIPILIYLGTRTWAALTIENRRTA